MIRAVLDTNIWISGFLFGGEVRRVLRAAVECKFEAVISQPLLSGLERVLSAGKFGLAPDVVAAFMGEVRNLADLARPHLKVRAVPRDPSDNAVLECAIAGRAAIVVTGDRHLLALASYRGIEILSASGFLQRLT